jgi:acyl-CoA synthetase (AMP-forming)/AMP-acid ligase II
MKQLPETNIVELLCERAQRHPERLALRFLGDGENVSEQWSYGQLHERALALAAQLQARAAAGERALLLYPSGPAYVEALLGCMYAGLVAVPAYPPLSAQPQHVGRVVAIAADAQPRLILTERALVGPLAALKRALPGLADTELLATDALAEAAPCAYRLPELGSSSLALLQYTSGSTAAPKGVMVGHAQLMANERAIRSAFAMRDDDVVVSWLPLFHDMGLIGTLLQPLFSGVCGVLFAPQQFMERPERWLRAMSRYAGTVSGAPDFAYRLCAQRIDQAAASELDLRGWRLAFCGAEPVRWETLQAFADKFAVAGFERAALHPCYGLAEATLLVSGGRGGAGVMAVGFDAPALADNRVVPNESGQQLVGCGMSQAGHDVCIADPQSGAPLAPGHVGEIQVSGPSVALGYWQNAAATAQTFVERAGRIYLRTGDLGFHHSGELFITGRYKDLIIIRGQNLYPQDIERSVEERIEVVRKGRSVVFSLEVSGEECIAVAAEVSPRVQKLIDPEAVCGAIRECVAEAHGEAPRVVLLLNPGAVPITSSGKLQRSACRIAWQKGRLDAFAVYESGTGTRLTRATTSTEAAPPV